MLGKPWPTIGKGTTVPSCGLTVAAENFGAVTAPTVTTSWAAPLLITSFEPAALLLIDAGVKLALPAGTLSRSVVLTRRLGAVPRKAISFAVKDSAIASEAVLRNRT